MANENKTTETAPEPAAATTETTAVPTPETSDESTAEETSEFETFLTQDTGAEPLDLDASESAPIEGKGEETTAGKEGEPAAEPAAEAAPAEPSAPAEPAPEPKPTEQVAQQPPAEKKPEETKPAEPAPVQPAGEPPKDANEVRTEALDLLATHHYALTQEEVDEFAESPEVAVPKLAARIYMDAVQNSLATVFGQLPALVEHALQRRQKAAEGEEDFFKTWPALREHKDDVVRFGQVYRQVNPKASSADFIRDVGAQVAVALRLPTESQPQAPQPNGNPAPATPGAPAFKPAASSPPAATSAPAPSNPFAALSLEEEPLDLD